MKRGFRRIIALVTLTLILGLLVAQGDDAEKAPPNRTTKVLGKVLEVRPKNDPRGLPSRLRWRIKLQISEAQQREFSLPSRVVEFYIHSPVRDLGKTEKELTGAMIVFELDDAPKARNFGKVKLLKYQSAKESSDDA